MTKLLIFLPRSIFYISLVLWSAQISAQDCTTGQFNSFTPSSQNRSINWNQFGEFSLPFTIIYGGPNFNNDFFAPLSHGFTHLSDPNLLGLVPKEQRAFIYYGTAYPNRNQPWELYRSPWENDLAIYEQKWKNDHQGFLSFLPEKNGLIESDIFVFDIERQWRKDFEILQLKTNTAIASNYTSLSNEDFLNIYKTDLAKLYNEPVKSFRNAGFGSGAKISSYSDAPIWNTFDNILGFSWDTWQNDPKVLNHVLKRNNNELKSDFDNNLDFYAPSAYFYYDYPHPFAGEYLSYLLFQIEVNKAWSSKPVIPFIWLRYSFNPQFQNSFIKPWMAESVAIFPFFSGADGVWLWENFANFQNDENFATYEYYLKGLKRLSTFKYMFEGNYELVIEQSARDLNEQKKAVWRGVVNDGKLLVAAHNPYAKDENEEIQLTINYKNRSRIINLKGYEVKLCIYDLNLLGLLEKEEIKLSVYPNPTQNDLEIEFFTQVAGEVDIDIFDFTGKSLFTVKKQAVLGQNKVQLKLDEMEQNIPMEVVLKITQNGVVGSKIIVVQ